MINRDAIIRGFYAKRKKFRGLLSISIYPSGDTGAPSDLDLDIVLRNEALATDNAVLLLRFGRIHELEINWGSLRFPWLDIYDITSRQWQDMNYRVIDDEHGSLKFFCKTFEFEVLPASHITISGCCKKSESP